MQQLQTVLLLYVLVGAFVAFFVERYGHRRRYRWHQVTRRGIAISTVVMMWPPLVIELGIWVASLLWDWARGRQPHRRSPNSQ